MCQTGCYHCGTMSTVTCPRCGTESALGKKFCAECGAPLPLLCSACGNPVRSAQKFCDECGAALQDTLPAEGTVTASERASARFPATAAVPTATPPGEERRLVTALFCDLVGFTPLSESLDPEEVRDLQAAYFAAMAEQVERYKGTVEKYAGDAILALFGTPIAHEDDPERAVLCALGMKTAIEPVAAAAHARWQVSPGIRVGVNTGEVVSGTWSVSGRQDVAVTGNAVNTASRIQAAADPGEVLVGLETMRLTRRRIRYGEKRELVLKGKSGPVPVYPAEGLREQFGEHWETQATPLIGRQHELLSLRDAWVRARAGEGGLVTLVGDAGVGKSRLITEFLERVGSESGVRVLRARCLSYGQEISLWLIADLLRDLFNVREEDPLDRVEARLEARLIGLVADEEARAEAQDVLGEILGLPPSPSPVMHAGPQIRRQALLRSLRLLLGTLSQRSPIILVMEDLHWLDEASQEVLHDILADVPGLPMLVLAAQRPGWTGPWTNWGWTDRLSLRPLLEAEAVALAQAILAVEPSPELQVYVAERTGGNPFFVEEMVRNLVETGGLEERDGKIALRTGVVEKLPSTLTEVLLARLDRLESPVRQLAQVASVVGRSFAVRLLAEVMEAAAETLTGDLHALQEAEIAFPRRGDDLEYVFKHVTMREAAYNMLVQKRRQELHLATARALALLYPSDEYVEMIAYHYARTTAPEAAEWLERAGDRASAVFANESAIESYREATDRLERQSDRQVAIARLGEKLGQILMRVGRFGDAITLLERAIDVYRLAQDLEGAGRATAVLGWAHSRQGTREEGLARVQPMIEQFAWSGPSSALASLHLSLARLLHFVGRYDEMQVAVQKAEEIARAIGDERLAVSAQERRGASLLMLGQPERAMDVLREAIPYLEAMGDLDVLGAALGNLGEAHRMVGDLTEAAHYNQRMLEVTERSGDHSNVGSSLLNLAEIQSSTGAWDEAEEHLARAEEVLATIGPTSWAAFLPNIRGRLLLNRGEWQQAEVQLLRAVGALPDAAHPGDGARLSLAELQILRGTPEMAVERLEMLTGRDGAVRVLLQVYLAWAYLDMGDVERADMTVAEAVESAREQHARLEMVDALRIQGMIRARQGRTEEAEHALLEALEEARSLPYPYAEGRILEQLHRVDEALAIFRRLRAAKDVERLESTSAARDPLPDVTA